MKKLILCAICAICGFTTANAQKFGHVNSQEVIQAMPEFAKARTDIEALTKQYEADLKSMQDELQKKAEAFDKEQALAKEQQEKMNAITTKVLDAIKAVGQAGGYIYIMDTTGGIPYISTTLSTDVTADVKKKLGI